MALNIMENRYGILSASKEGHSISRDRCARPTSPSCRPPTVLSTL